MTKIAERYVFLNEQTEQAKGHAEFIRLVGKRFPESIRFNGWRKGYGGFVQSRWRENTSYQDVTARHGFSYGDGMFYQTDAARAKLEQVVMLSEHEVANTRRNLLRRKAGDVVLRILRVEANIRLLEPLPPGPEVSDGLLRDYWARFGRVGVVGWDSNIVPRNVYTSFAFRPDGSVSAAYMHSSNASEAVTCPLPPADYDPEPLDRMFQASLGAVRLMAY
jgi:hypothetical protein